MAGPDRGGLTIGIDARELLGQRTGVGRYLGELLREWARPPGAGDPPHRFLLFTPEPLPDPQRWIDPADPRFELRVAPGRPGTWWEQTTLPRALAAARPDVFFAPAYTGPLLAPTPLALTIHDLAFFHRPAWFRPREGARRRWITRRAARKARRILTDSAASREEILHHLGVPAARVRRIPLGVRDRSLAAGREESRQPLVLFIGSIFNRRRVPELIRAFAAVARSHPDVRLEIVGENRTHPPQDLAAVAREAAVEDRLALRPWVDDEVLDNLLARARAFAFLSEYEGFGLTPLEAMAAGVPALVGDIPVAREVYGDAALYAPPGDTAAAARALEALLFDEDLRRIQIERGRARAGRYPWERTARETLEALAEAVRG